ncbi:hypothetical protein BU23DRAFT_503963 [Bimuria novae-zelandiae CBS 107.79]|uniref:Large ribosomal subunit protein mL54 n=1 Tax=Bimuria novae-zelandiae CBS 107.79 TaxID=1447943 RepID=A0A6A5VF41_9PLEO|nr:hypothetical protein BU23DRAFT_503963 [Bimuria novae-zelandiae CBS 107.79]
MICRTCLRAASRIRIPPPTSMAASRAFTTAQSRLNATSSHTPPAATSTSAAQPFSEPLTPAAKKDGNPAADKKAPIVRSSVPAGTPLKGLNFLKDRQDPVALADEDYPEWLWTLLERQEKKGESATAGDLFSKSKKQRRLAAKRLRKEQLANPEMLVPKVPLYEQTIDLPAGDETIEGAVKARQARSELTKAMRYKRRAQIKERNFLKAMG